LRGKEQGAAVCGHGDSCNCVCSQQQQARVQATVAKAEAATGQTTINLKEVAIAAELVNGAGGDSGRCGSGSGNGGGRWQWRGQHGSHVSGDSGVNLVPTVAQGAADVGGGHLLYLLLFA